MLKFRGFPQTLDFGFGRKSEGFGRHFKDLQLHSFYCGELFG